MLLSGMDDRGRSVVLYRSQREDVKEARRILEGRFGDAVRLTSATETRLPVAMKGAASRVPGAESSVRMPTWSMRPFITIPKPKRVGFPFVFFTVLDPVTREPVKHTVEFEEAFLEAERLLTRKKVRNPYTSKSRYFYSYYQDLIDNEVALLDKIDEMKQVLERRIASHRRELKRYETPTRDLSMTTPGAGRGAGPDEG